MEPPVCALCDRDRRDHPGLLFDLVKFRDCEAIDLPGHPDGGMWFCQYHLRDASRYEYLTSEEAMRRLRKEAARPRWIRALLRLFGR